ncbi:ATL2.2 family protein [Megaselia abdita]
MSEGRPIQIIKSAGDDFELNEDVLEKILSNDDISDHSIVVISVAGAFRKGKSFLLGFFIRFLEAMYVKKDASNWIGNRNDEAPLEGFSWTNGQERETTGIWMWSEIFQGEIKGEKIAIVLLDTQGVFDNKTSTKNCSLIFGLSTLLSSVQIYNLSGHIQEDDIQHLELFTSYGKLALDDTGNKPFQQLLFLIRDWSYPYNHEYGLVGGNRMITKYLQTSEHQNEELKSIREHLQECFTKIDCFLMPHPGLKVLNNKNFDGQLKDISDDFLNNLDSLARMILSPDRLIIKEVNGEKVSVKELFQFMRIYLETLKGDEFPEPKSIFEATAEVNLMNIFTSNLFGKTEKLSAKEFSLRHGALKNEILKQFDDRRKIGDPQNSLKYREQLISYLDKLCQIHSRINNNKNEMALVQLECTRWSLIAEAKELYINEMEKALKSNVSIKNFEFSQIHDKVKAKSMEMFKKKCGQNGVKYEDYSEELANDLENLSIPYNNRAKGRENDNEHLIHSKIVHDAFDSYCSEMEEVLEDQQAVSRESFELCHKTTKTKKIEGLSSEAVGQPDLEKLQKILETRVNDFFGVFEQRFAVKEKIFQVQAEANNLKLINELRSDYMSNMNRFLSNNKDVSLEILQAKHLEYKNEAIDEFNASRVGGDQTFDRYLRSLDESIEEVYLIYKAKFDNKYDSWTETLKELGQILLMIAPIAFEILKIFKKF